MHCASGVGKEHGLHEANHHASPRAGRVTLSYVCPHCHRFLLEDHIRWVSAEHSDSGEKKNERNWRQLEVRSMRRPAQPKGPEQSPGDTRQRGSQRSKGVPSVRTLRREVVAGLPSALSKQLASLQAGMDNLADTIIGGSQQRSTLKITNEFRRFIDVKNHEAVKIGDLDGNSEEIKVIRPNLKIETFPNAAIREEVDDQTLRAKEVGILHTSLNSTKVGDSRWRPSLPDDD